MRQRFNVALRLVSSRVLPCNRTRFEIFFLAKRHNAGHVGGYSAEHVNPLYTVSHALSSVVVQNKVLRASSVLLGRRSTSHHYCLTCPSLVIAQPLLWTSRDSVYPSGKRLFTLTRAVRRITLLYRVSHDRLAVSSHRCKSRTRYVVLHDFTRPSADLSSVFGNGR